MKDFFTRIFLFIFHLINMPPALEKPFIQASEITPATALWMQQHLRKGGYYKGEIDGHITRKFLNALALFKSRFFLGEPDQVDTITLNYLRRVEPPHQLSSEHAMRNFQKNPHAGSLSEKSKLLLGGDRIYENEFVHGRIPLTWGELTHGLTRLPDSHDHLENLYALASVFGSVRLQFGSELAVLSGYRPPRLDVGDRLSTHRFGKGMDIVPLSFQTASEPEKSEMMERLIKICQSIPAIGGIGVADYFVHFDIRERDSVGDIIGTPVNWFYQ